MLSLTMASSPSYIFFAVDSYNLEMEVPTGSESGRVTLSLASGDKALFTHAFPHLGIPQSINP